MEQVVQRILIVDNDPLFCQLAADFFTKGGYEVRFVESGAACLDLLLDYQPDIIFLDLIMPEMGGDDLCRAIRNIDRFKETYLVIVSAVASEHEIDFATCGADSCIVKAPFQLMREPLTEAIRRASVSPREQPSDAVLGASQLHPRQITHELLQRTQHVRLILESMSQGIIELCADRVMFMNRSAGEMLGMQFIDAVGLRMDEVFPPPLNNHLASQPKTAEGERRRTTLHLHDRQLVVEELNLRGSFDSRIIMLSDITENKKMEAVIEAANLTENLGYVFSGIRHEIGNPVNSIKMALSVLQRNLMEYDQATVAEFLDRTLQEVARIEYLLKALKNYSLFEKPLVENISLAEFLKNFIALSHSDLEDKGIRLRSIIASDQLMVRADSRALHHVLLNLLSNAVDALDGTAKPEIIISCTASGERVEIKVDDNGKGIAETDQENLFKPFFTSKAKGTGLGLVIVKKMVAAMQGSIQVQSYQGLGTTVTITLPGMS